MLLNLWQELDHYRVFEMKDPEDATTLRKFIEKDQVYDFLAGLNSEFDQVRVQILGKDEVPFLEETISMIQAEESRRGVMLETQNVEGSAMVVAKSELSHPIQENVKEVQFPKTFGSDKKKNLWCNYCKKTGRTKETCWKFHGKPREGNQRGGQQPQQPQNYGQANLSVGQQGQEPNLMQIDLK